MKRKEQTIVEKEIPGREHAGYAYIYPLDGGARQEYVLEMTPENIANFIGAHQYDAEKIILTDMLDNLILDTAGGFIMNCPDQILCGRVLPLLAPIQMGGGAGQKRSPWSAGRRLRRMLPRRTSLAHSSEVAHMEIRRGDIYYADLTPVVGCEQGGRRPVLVIQNDVGNHHGSTVIVAAITSRRRRRKRRLPTHIGLPRLPTGLRTASFAMLEQVRTIDRMRLGAYIGRLDGERMAAVDRAILISFGLDGLVGYDGKNAEK